MVLYIVLVTSLIYLINNCVKNYIMLVVDICVVSLCFGVGFGVKWKNMLNCDKC